MIKAVGNLLSVVLLFLFFSNTLSEFLFSDDIQNFHLRNSLAVAYPDTSFVKVAMDGNASWMTQGRFTPLSFLWQEIIFMKIPSVMAYRWFVLLMNFAGIAAFMLFMHKLPIKISPVVWIVCLCAVMQFRIQYHDAYTSLHGMYQFLTVLIFMSLTSYVLYIRKERWYYLLFSCMLYIAALLQGEVGMTVFFLMPAVGLFLIVPLQKLWKQFLPYFAITVAYLGCVIWLKMNIADKGNIYQGLQSNFDVAEMLILFLRQTYACLPLTNLHRQIGIPQLIYHRFTTLPLLTIVIAAISVGLLWYSSKKDVGVSGGFNWRFVLFALLLMIVPALFILPSLKYQQTMPMGVGYLPVYLQNLGTATLLAYILHYIFTRNQFAGYLFSAFITLCVIVTFLFNSAMISARSYELSVPMLSQYKSLKEGIMKDVPRGSVVLMGYFWNSAWFYDEVFVNLCSKRFSVIDAHGYSPSPADTTKSCYLLESLPGNPVYTKLYEVNCATGERGKTLAERIHCCDIHQTEQEKVILHRAFK
jgi:hypothetical protein